MYIEIEITFYFLTVSDLCSLDKAHIKFIGIARCVFQVFRKYLMFCGIGLTNAQLFELSVQEYKRNRVSNCTADQHLNFSYSDRKVPLLVTSKVLSFYLA